MQRILLFAGLVLLLTAGCRGWDDDSEYEIRTQASFFLAVANGGKTLHRLQDGVLRQAWNTEAGIPDRDLSDVDMRDNFLWLSSGNQKTIVKAHPGTGEVEESFSDLPLSPHFIAVGEDQIMAVDTSIPALAFVKLRNGKVTEAIFEGRPRTCIYSNGRFYLNNLDTQVWVYDEKALATRAELDITQSIVDLQLNRFNNVHVQSQDSSQLYEAIIPGNADYISRETFAVNYQKIRYTPYFSSRYTTEFLDDLQLVGTDIQTPAGNVLVSGAENFEADFFGGTIYYSRNDSLFVYDLSTEVVTAALPFPFVMERAYHQYSGVQ